MASGIQTNVEQLVEILGALLVKLDNGHVMTWRDWARIALQVWKVIRENDTPMLYGGERSCALDHVALYDTVPDIDPTIEELADRTCRLAQSQGRGPVEWKRDGTLLKQVLQLLLQLLPTLI